MLTTTAIAPSTPASGSTTPLNWPYLMQTHDTEHTPRLVLPFTYYAFQRLGTTRLYKINVGSNSHQKLLQTSIPAALRGMLTARPSGKFCIPIPRARFLKKINMCVIIALLFHSEEVHLALSKVAEGDLPIAPKPTPTAKPSEKSLVTKIKFQSLKSMQASVYNIYVRTYLGYYGQ